MSGHSIPDVYGAIQPTAVFVPLEQILDERNFELVTTEVFGPVQVIRIGLQLFCADVECVCPCQVST